MLIYNDPARKPTEFAIEMQECLNGQLPELLSQKAGLDWDSLLPASCNNNQVQSVLDTPELLQRAIRCFPEQPIALYEMAAGSVLLCCVHRRIQDAQYLLLHGGRRHAGWFSFFHKVVPKSTASKVR